MTKPVQFVFPSLEIRELGGLTGSQSLDAEAVASIGVDVLVEGIVSVDYEFSVGTRDILLQGRARGAWRLECSSCLAPATAPFEAHIERLYDVNTPEIDISEEIREALLLAVPYRVLCRQDCRGLCPHCGKNLNAGSCGCKSRIPSPFSRLKKPQV